MGQSIMRNYLHISFSTKHRQPFITESVEPDLHNYLGGVCNKLDCQPLIVGGYYDHVHILCMLSKKIAAVKLLEEIKSHSSRWMKTKGSEFEQFYWQDGYGAFAVSFSNVDAVKAYLANQESHHRVQTFQDEFREILRRHEMEWDERYVWD